MEFKYGKERIYIENEEGEVIAEVTFPITDGIADINHTFVDDSFRGQGIASQLMEQAASYLEKENLKVRTTCSYAKKWFEKNGKETVE